MSVQAASLSRMPGLCISVGRRGLILRRAQGGPIRPNPFLYDALDKRREEVANAFARYIDDIRRQNRL